MLYLKKLLILSIILLSWVSCFSLAEDSSDAIAIRVIPNPNNYSPLRWYKENIKNQGAPQSLTVDGYEAVRDGRTVYVNAANVIDSNLGSDANGDGDKTNDWDKLFTNIYLISYNQGADVKTVDIFGQILSHWKFNTNLTNTGQCSKTVDIVCSINGDCPNPEYCSSFKAGITRDTLRLSSLANIKSDLELYQDGIKHYPKLESGSYLPYKTISVWPSWQETLARELNATLTVDPINQLGPCNSFNKTTCWNEATKQFADPTPGDENFNLPNSSLAMVYTTDSQGSVYNLCAIMESVSITNLAGSACAGSIAPNDPPLVNCGHLIGYASSKFIGYVGASDPNYDKLNNWSIDTSISSWLGWSSAPQLKNTAVPNQKQIFADQAGPSGDYNLKITVYDIRGASSIKECVIKIY